MHIGNQSFVEISNRGSRSSRAETWRRAISAAIASAMGGVAEGYALHATALHPQLWPWPEEASRADPSGSTGWNERHTRLPQQSHRHLPQRSQTVMSVSSFEPHETMQWVSPREISHDGDARWRARIASLPRKVWSWILRVNELRRDAATLEALDDRTLKDMGISRAEIGYLVRHGRSWW